MQVTRGVARRDHPFPKNPQPSLVMTAKRVTLPSAAAVENGVRVISIRDIRWERCDIKTVALLPTVLGKQQAREAAAYEAWQVDDDGYATAGPSTNAWLGTQAGELITRTTTPATH